MEIPRRTVLTGVSVAIAGSVAGCVGGGSEDEGPGNVDFDQNDSDVDPDEISIPTFTMTFTHDEEEGVVSVRHSGGRSVSIDNLYIRGEGIGDEYDEVSFVNLPDSEFSSGDNFGSGDSVTVGVVEDQFRVEAVWVDSETGYPKTIDQMSVGMSES